MPAGPPPRGSSAPTAPSWIALDGAVNVRDLGGRPVRGGGRVRPGLVLRSDSLQGLSPRDVALLVDDLGVRTVLDLRTDWERRSEGPGPLSRHPVTHHALSLVPEAEAGDRGQVSVGKTSASKPFEDASLSIRCCRNQR